MNILDTLQRIAILFLLGFPLIMICLIGFLSISVLNVGTIYLFIGQVILVPSIKDALSTSSFNVAPSFWVAHVVFLCSYIFTNAYTVYVVDTKSGPAASGPKWKLENRRARSFMIMVTCVLALIALIVSRYLMTGAETVFGILIGLIAFIPAGYYWYQIAIKNDSQNGDIFGIMQQLIPSVENDANASLCIKT